MPHDPPGLRTDDENLMTTPRAKAVLEDAAAAVAGLDALDTPTTPAPRTMTLMRAWLPIENGCVPNWRGR